MDRLRFLRLGAGAAAAAAMNGADVLARGLDGVAYSRQQDRKFGAWVGNYESLERWKRELARLRGFGVNTILPSAPNDVLGDVVPIARDEGIAVHAWRPQMMNAGPLAEHPEWYAVSRSGKSTAVEPPYVDYYRFFCPSREDVHEWLVARVREVASIDGLASVHLDYIRVPDVILPVALWPKYDLVQDREYPDFDFCYCDVCRAKFREQTGLDPLELEDPPSHEAWVRFRWDAITNVVSKLHDAVHAEGRNMTAAVFPTPRIARSLVRQDWVNWTIDALMPMVYHSFYNEPVEWIGRAVREGTTALDGRIPLYPGLYVHELTPAELERGARLALDAGAQGVMLFDAGAATDEHWRRLQAAGG